MGRSAVYPGAKETSEGVDHSMAHQLVCSPELESKVAPGTRSEPRSPVDGSAPSADVGEPVTKVGTSTGVEPCSETYPEGGLQACLVVFGSFCGLFASLGLQNTIAVFQTYLGMHQLSEYSNGTIGWVFTLSTFFSFFCGIYIGHLFDKYGSRLLLITGGCGIVLSLILASFSTRGCCIAV